MVSVMQTTDPFPPGLEHLPERVLDRVLVHPDGCWLWTGATYDGYGYTTVPGASSRRIHRALYEVLVAPVPQHLVLDHLCRNRACCNPDHLEPVTDRENILRGEGPTARNARKTHCSQGHELTPENTRTRPGRSNRECKTCRRVGKRRYNAIHRPERASAADIARWAA